MEWTPLDALLVTAVYWRGYLISAVCIKIDSRGSSCSCMWSVRVVITCLGLCCLNLERYAARFGEVPKIIVFEYLTGHTHTYCV